MTSTLNLNFEKEFLPSGYRWGNWCSQIEVPSPRLQSQNWKPPSWGSKALSLSVPQQACTLLCEYRSTFPYNVQDPRPGSQSKHSWIVPNCHKHKLWEAACVSEENLLNSFLEITARLEVLPQNLSVSWNLLRFHGRHLTIQHGSHLPHRDLANQKCG
jgi:hypothetical protein